jgi:hypothetical protein
MAGMSPSMTGLGIARGALRRKSEYKAGQIEYESWKPRFLQELDPSSFTAGGVIASGDKKSDVASGDIHQVD